MLGKGRVNGGLVLMYRFELHKGLETHMYHVFEHPLRTWFVVNSHVDATFKWQRESESKKKKEWPWQLIIMYYRV